MQTASDPSLPCRTSQGLRSPMSTAHLPEQVETRCSPNVFDHRHLCSLTSPGQVPQCTWEALTSPTRALVFWATVMLTAVGSSLHVCCAPVGPAFQGTGQSRCAQVQALTLPLSPCGPGPGESHLRSASMSAAVTWELFLGCWKGCRE